MITFELSPDVLGNTRFAFSPLGEATLSLRLLGSPRPAHTHVEWLRRARERLDRVDLELLLAVAPQGRWVASCLVPTEVRPASTIEQQLEELSHLPPEVLAHDLREVWEEIGVPRAGQQLLDEGAAAPARLAKALWDYWDAVIAPFWPRMVAVLESDVSYRISRLLAEGLYGLMGDLHPDIALEGNRLRIHKPLHADATYRASAMVMVPSVFAWPTVTLEDGTHDVFGLTYPVRGVGLVWEGLDKKSHSDDGPLANLLGRTRAAVLELAAVPMSTTHIARQLGQSPGSVSQHLAVLRDAGLVWSRRSGKSVLYAQTPLALSITSAHSRSSKRGFAPS